MHPLCCTQDSPPRECRARKMLQYPLAGLLCPEIVGCYCVLMWCCPCEESVELVKHCETHMQYCPSQKKCRASGALLHVHVDLPHMKKVQS